MSSSMAPPSPIKFWVNFKGDGVVSIRKSRGVSSVVDNGTGFYTVNLISPMLDTNYLTLVTVGGANAARGVAVKEGSVKTVSSFEIQLSNINGVGVDAPEVHVIGVDG